MISFFLEILLHIFNKHFLGLDGSSREEKMFARAVRIMIEKVMSLHDYVFDGKIIRQKMGGSIGLDLTGVVADIVAIGTNSSKRSCTNLE